MEAFGNEWENSNPKNHIFFSEMLCIIKTYPRVFPSASIQDVKLCKHQIIVQNVTANFEQLTWSNILPSDFDKV